MANPRQLAILQQGVEAWNTWRRANKQTQRDLTEADLDEADLAGVDLEATDLRRAHLRRANLAGADLRRANLAGADLTGATLRGATLIAAILTGALLDKANLAGADLAGANLTGADLSGVDLGGAHLYITNLTGADLSGVDLGGADLSEVDLGGADLTYARVGWTTFSDVDLRTVKGLETVEHSGPSTIGTNTLVRSQGNIPEIFLRKAGLPDTFLTYIRSLVTNPIEYYTCFISYSSKDQDFVERLYADLQSKGVRCWLDKEDLKTGDKIRDRIYQSIRLHDKLLLVLSQHSINSPWVEVEVETAIAIENTKNTLMLFPIRLDSAVKDSQTSWAALIRNMRHITDFSNWKQQDAYQKGLNRLLRDLKQEAPPIAKQE